MVKENLHTKALELMEKLDSKYNMINELSLDEYLYEYRIILDSNDINEINKLINKFDNEEI
jgi:hypothetical protein